MRSPPPPPSEPAQFQSERATTVVLAGLGMTLLAMLFGVGPLVVTGLGLVVLALFARAWARFGIRRTWAQRRLLEAKVLEGEPVQSVIVVGGPRLALGALTVQDQLSGRELPLAAGRGAPGAPARARHARRELHVTVPAGRRGRHLYPPPTVISEDPLGLARAVRAASGPADELIVLPATEQIRWLRAGRRRRGRDDVAALEPTGAGEVDGLRDYRPGAPATRIHWPALARGAGLLERRLVSGASTLPLIVLDPRCDRPPEGHDRLDAAVRATASLTLELARHGGVAVLLPGSRVPLAVGRDLRTWPALHTRLALVEGERNWRRTPPIRAEMVGGALLYVTASEAIDLSPLISLRLRDITVVVPSSGVAASGDAAVFEVSGCRGYALQGRLGSRAA